MPPCIAMPLAAALSRVAARLFAWGDALLTAAERLAAGVGARGH